MNQSGNSTSTAETQPPSKGLEASIAFPALCFSQGFVNLIHSLDKVSSCTKLGFKNGYYKELVLVDTRGSRFQVVGACKLRTTVANLTQAIELLTGNPHWQVELRFSPRPSKVSLEELKNLISDSFKREKYHWDAMVDFEEFQEKIAAAVSLEQIFSAFTEYDL